MDFEFDQAIAILERTPAILDTWLAGLPEAWTLRNDGGESWSPYDIVGHFVHGEKKDWITRAELILAEGGPHTFEPFDRLAQFRDSQGQSLEALLARFAELRAANLDRLRGFGLAPDDYDRIGRHPALGPVTLRQLLSTWVAHDLNHLAHIAEVMAAQYREQVGPWQTYLGILGGKD